jgi:hypothetical protein
MKSKTQLLFGNPLDKLDPLIEAGNFFVDVINAILSGDSGFLIETFLSLILLIPNLLFWVIFRLLSGVAGFLYDFMLATTTRAPVPRTSSGSIAIIRSPASDDVFAGLQAVIEGSIIPISLVFVVFGIAIVLFVRVFDVVVKLNFNGEEAQRRLLVAPILISLWIPLANLVLGLALGLTSLFLDGISVDPADYGGTDSLSLDSDGNISPVDMLVEGAVGDLEDNPKNFITGSDPIPILFRLLFGIYISIFIVPVALIAAFLAVLRLVLLYIFYTLGPVGIMMWAITWRDIGSLGEKIVRYFVLLALFPIPAALMSVLLPVISIGVEEAVVAGFQDIFGTGADSATGDLDFIDTESMVQIMMAGASIVIIGFAPWALVMGVGKATALAGTAAGVSAVAATGGTAAVAGGVGKATSKAPGATEKLGKKVASNRITKGAYNKMGEDKQQKIQSAADSASAAKRSASSMAGSAKSAVADNTVGRSATLKAGSDKLSEAMDSADISEITNAGTGYAAGALTTMGFSNFASVVDKSGEGIEKKRKMNEKVNNAKKERRKAGEMIRSESAENDIIDDMPDDVGKAEMDLMERAAADGMDKNSIKELAARSDRIEFDESSIDDLFEEGNYGNEELTSDGKKIVGETLMEEVANANNREELVGEFGRPMANRMMEETSFDVEEDYSNMAQYAEESDLTTREELLSGNLEAFEEYRGNDVRGANPFTNESRWVLDEREFDEEKAKAADEQLGQNAEEYSRSALTSLDGLTDDADQSLTAEEHDELAKAYRNGNVRSKAEEIIEKPSDDIIADEEEFDGDNFHENLAQNVRSQIQSDIKNSKQIPMLQGNQGDLSQEDISLLPENSIESAISDTEEGVEVNSDEISVDEERASSLITSARPEDREFAMGEFMQELENEVEPQLERSKQYQEASPDKKEEMKNRIKSAVREDIQVITDQESDMLAEHLNQMDDALVEETTEQLENAGEEVTEDAINGELSGSSIADTIRADEVEIIEETVLKNELESYTEDRLGEIPEELEKTITEVAHNTEFESTEIALDNIRGEGVMSPEEFVDEIGLSEKIEEQQQALNESIDQSENQSTGI